MSDYLGFSRYGDYYELETDFGFVTTEYQHARRTLYIGYVYVEPSFRGKGHGRYLTEKALNLAHELGAESVLGSLASPEGKGMAYHMFDKGSLKGNSLVVY